MISYILEIELSVELPQGEGLRINWVFSGAAPRLRGVILPHRSEGILQCLPDYGLAGSWEGMELELSVAC